MAVLQPNLLGYAHNESPTSTPLDCEGILEESLRFINAKIVIIDDVDKFFIRLGIVETLRRTCDLVIFTANNGGNDQVLDNAWMRPARVDEVFEIDTIQLPQRVPFDKLTSAQWEEACAWPMAFLNELELRLVKRPDDIRFEDLAARVRLRTQSKSVLA